MIASHIKPWKNANDTERLDANNGLLLIPTFDKLFDKGLITFDQNGRLVNSNAFEIDDAVRTHIIFPSQLNSTYKNELQGKYMSHHRDKVFKK